MNVTKDTSIFIKIKEYIKYTWILLQTSTNWCYQILREPEREWKGEIDRESYSQTDYTKRQGMKKGIDDTPPKKFSLRPI